MLAGTQGEGVDGRSPDVAGFLGLLSAKDDFTALFSGNFGEIAIRLRETDSERIRIAMSTPGAGATNDHCYTFSLRRETPKEIQQMLAVYMETFGAASTIAIFKEIFKGLHICFPEGFESVFPMELLRQIPWISFIEHDSMVHGEIPMTNPLAANDYGGQLRMGSIRDGLSTQSSSKAKEASVNTFIQALERRLGAVAAQGASSPPVNVQQNAPWGLSRISQPKRPLNDRCYEYASTGDGVNIYIVDSGVDVRHPEFEDRAKIVFVAPGLLRPGNEAPLPDCSGHGTEVASVAAGRLSGVAKHARILALQVLSCNGQGRNSDLIAALEWIAANYEHPGIVNLSLGGPRSITLDMAVEAVIARGIPVVVAAGNDGANACEFSPAHLPLSMTVGASTQTDERAEFSNYGKCVKIFAPGYQIQVAKANIEHANGGSSHGGFSTSTSTSLHVLAATEPGFQSCNDGFHGEKDIFDDGNENIEDDNDGSRDRRFDKGNCGNFVFSSGTSLAAPAVAGVAALIMERYPEISIPRLWSLVRVVSQKDSIHASTLRGSPNLLLQSPPGIDVDLLALNNGNDYWNRLRTGNCGATNGASSPGLSPFTWSWILISALMILGLFGMFAILAGARIIKTKKAAITRGRSHYRDDPWVVPSTPSRGRTLTVY